MRLHMPCGPGRVMGHGCALAIGSRSHHGIALHTPRDWTLLVRGGGGGDFREFLLG